MLNPGGANASETLEAKENGGPEFPLEQEVCTDVNEDAKGDGGQHKIIPGAPSAAGPVDADRQEDHRKRRV